MDVLLTRLEQPLQQIYKMFTGKYADPSVRFHTMAFEEWMDCMTRGGLSDENFGIREFGPMFSQSMMTNMQEVDTNNHINMKFVEFLEALARVADKQELKNMNDTYPDHKPKNPWNLDKKMEIIILKLIEALIPKKQADKFLEEYKERKDKELEAGGRM